LKMRIASLTILCLALAAVPAFAQSYDNGPINGTTDAWTINFGYVVSDTFNWSGGTLNQASIGVWEFPGDTGLTVDYTISSTENGAGVGATENVKDTFISTNQFGYNVDTWTFNTGGVPLSAGTYWLNLANATVASGNPVYWDENSGVGCGGTGCPSSASESSVGTIAGEAFTVTGSSPSTPEPSSIMLFGSGILGLAGVLRRKLF
jgi:PEP-CTERM motif-containing protein